MMELEVQTSEAPWLRPPDSVTAAVHFVGDWRGVTLIECTSQQACQFAARFMGIDQPAEIDSDVRDVMGELANMVAGNLKSLLPRGVDLSMPCVVEGSDYNVSMCGLGAVERMPFASATGNFCITLIEMLQPA